MYERTLDEDIQAQSDGSVSEEGACPFLTIWEFAMGKTGGERQCCTISRLATTMLSV
jgi:hypothetical protein